MRGHTAEEIHQAVSTHPMEEWRTWFETRSPKLIRVFHVKPAFSMISASGNIGGGHLGSQDWHDRGIGVAIVAPITAGLIQELIGNRPFAPGYIHLTRMQVCLFMVGVPTQLEWVMEKLDAGATEIFIPVEFFFWEEGQHIRARLRTDIDPP